MTTTYNLMLHFFFSLRDTSTSTFSHSCGASLSIAFLCSVVLDFTFLILTPLGPRLHYMIKVDIKIKISITLQFSKKNTLVQGFNFQVMITRKIMKNVFFNLCFKLYIKNSNELRNKRFEMR